MPWHRGGHRAGPSGSIGQSSLQGDSLTALKYHGGGKSQGCHRPGQTEPRPAPNRALDPHSSTRGTDRSQPPAKSTAKSSHPRPYRAHSTQCPQDFNLHPTSPPCCPQGCPGHRGWSRDSSLASPSRSTRRALAVSVLQSLFSHHRPFLPCVLNPELSVKVRARFADSLCRKHGGAGESKAFAAGRPCFGRRCSPLRDWLSFPKSGERFVSHLKLTAEIPRARHIRGHGRRRPLGGPEASGCSEREAADAAAGPGLFHSPAVLVGAQRVGGGCQRVLVPLQFPAVGTEVTLSEQEEGTPGCPHAAPRQEMTVLEELAVMPRGMRAAAWHRAQWGAVGGTCRPSPLPPGPSVPVLSLLLLLSPHLSQGISYVTPQREGVQT